MMTNAQFQAAVADQVDPGPVPSGPLTSAELDLIPVHKVKLQARVAENRNKHEQDYNAAYVEYLAALQVRFKEFKQAFKKDPTKATYHMLSAPVSYLKLYDQVLAKLNLTTAEIIELNDSEFSNYVQDDWNWKTDFNRMSQTYSSISNTKR